MADRLVVIGRGRLIAAGSVDDFRRSVSSTTVLVRTPQTDQLARVLLEERAEVQPQPDGALLVTGPDQAKVGELAFSAGVVLHELTTRTATLEEAFLEATGGAQEYVAQVGWGAAPPPGGPGIPPGGPYAGPAGGPYATPPGGPYAPGPGVAPPGTYAAPPNFHGGQPSDLPPGPHQGSAPSTPAGGDR